MNSQFRFIILKSRVNCKVKILFVTNDFIQSLLNGDVKAINTYMNKVGLMVELPIYPDLQQRERLWQI